MIIYKFRPLRNHIDLDRATQVLETGLFWCSQFSELNDPMEGVINSRNNINEHIYSEKCRYKICSFCGKDAFENPVMWGYYANGFKGIAIAIEVIDENVRRVEYIADLRTLEYSARAKDIEKILTMKLAPWKHEEEYRFLIESNSNLHNIGTFKTVYFGDPYGDIVNREEIYKGSNDLKGYENRKAELTKVINNKIKCLNVKVDHCKVISNGAAIKMGHY